MEVLQERKIEAIKVLRKRTALQHAQLESIDPRLAEYYDHCCKYASATPGDENDLHNLYELLCAIRLLRLLRTYELDLKKVHEVIYDGEGEWKLDDEGFWVHVRGGLRQPSRKGRKVYRWEPFQIFCLVAMYGPKAWIGTETYKGERRLFETERINEETGEIEDLRRLCTRFVMFGPRKINKTGFCAITNVEDFMRGDADAQIFCCANSQEQSKILYKKTQDLLEDLDPTERRIRFTATETTWREHQFRSAEMKALAAGGKMQDGTFASRCAADEYGSSEYTNGKSDMGQTVAVIESSMGPRREPMTVITTTAGLIKNGPFIEMLSSIRIELLRELDYDSGSAIPAVASDRQMYIILEPDEWERDEDYLFTLKPLRRKINPMLGKIVQHSFYDQAVVEARQDETKKRETIAKLFNVYANSRVSEWIKPQEIREVQIPTKIDDCTVEQGWEVYVGSDFSKGDDLNGNSYLAVRWREDLGEMEFFADMDSYISETAVNDSPVRELWLHWAKEGHVHIVPGRTFDPAVAVNRIIDLDTKGVSFFGFGYDPYNAKTVINALSQWLIDVGLDPLQLIQSVRQNFATYSPAVKEFDFMLRRGIQMPDGTVTPSPQIHFSMNPMWPWEFGNCQLAESNDGMENFKPVKANASASCKVDNIQMLLTALVLFDAAETKKNK